MEKLWNFFSWDLYEPCVNIDDGFWPELKPTASTVSILFTHIDITECED